MKHNTQQVHFPTQNRVSTNPALLETIHALSWRLPTTEAISDDTCAEPKC